MIRGASVILISARYFSLINGLLGSPGVLIRRAGSGTAATNLRPGGVGLGQSSAQSNAAAGNFGADSMRRLERGINRDFSPSKATSSPSSTAPPASAPGNGGDHRGFLVRAGVEGYRLASGEARRAGNRNRSGSRFRGGGHRGTARRTDGGDNRILPLGTGINADGLAGVEFRDTRDLEVVCPGSRFKRQNHGRLHVEVAAVAPGIGSIRESSGTSGRRRTAKPATPAKAAPASRTR